MTRVNADTNASRPRIGGVRRTALAVAVLIAGALSPGAAGAADPPVNPVQKGEAIIRSPFADGIYRSAR